MNELEVDVAVLGGGPAGIAAALGAARMGASTLLIERYGFLGGMSTISLVYPWQTFHTMAGKQVIRGVAQDIVDELVRRNASPGHLRDTIGFVHTLTPFDPDMFKLVAAEMLLDSGCRLMLHTYVAEAEAKDGHIASVKVVNKSGMQTVKSKIFIDTTGDADVAYWAGTEVLKGRESDHKTQPMTMKFRMNHVNIDAIRDYMKQHPDEFYKKSLIADLDRIPLTGVQGFYKHWKEADLPILRDQVLFFIGPREDEVLINQSRVSGYDGTQVEDLTKAEVEGRRQVVMIAEFLNRQIPGFENARITQVGTQIGVRETRRAVGLYQLNRDDVIQGRKFEDVIARSGYPIDIHDPSGKGVDSAWIGDDGAYDIPYRCLLPKEVDNLLMAGRCMSTTHDAHSTTWLTPSCMATGQAAGTAAAMAALKGVSPHDLQVGELQRNLLTNRADLGFSLVDL
ncbi:FAD-dependent oxidoreductase [Fodinisporobacter ferrooxydans]|uniref:FAD-dependent oxidoreductase n=1 Tax=Fodinisporobacter ferrooxydans TaxID=2901836 RepID=A0ABY4CK15_9BACL|nr:FAD-dependent oxidoreductase [Alicyclobacillaceae bacterium MYW30-H2]